MVTTVASVGADQRDGVSCQSWDPDWLVLHSVGRLVCDGIPDGMVSRIQPSDFRNRLSRVFLCARTLLSPAAEPGMIG